MARTYKRDSNGRFSGGGGGGGGKLGKSDKNQSARDKYKKAAGEARASSKSMAARAAKGTTVGDKIFKAEAKRTKANLTRVTNQLTGKKGKKAAPRPKAAPKAKSAPKASKSHLAGIEKARASGRKKGAAIAAKVSARNAALDRKAKAYGG